MKKICFPRIRKGYEKLVSVLRRRGGRKRTEQLPAMLLEAERSENEQHAVEQLAVMQHEAMQCEDELRGNEQLAEEQHAVVQHEDEQRVNEHHGKAEACNQQQCSLREFCLKRFSEKRDAHAAGGASPDKAKR